MVVPGCPICSNQFRHLPLSMNVLPDCTHYYYYYCIAYHWSYSCSVTAHTIFFFFSCWSAEYNKQRRSCFCWHEVGILFSSVLMWTVRMYKFTCLQAHACPSVVCVCINKHEQSFKKNPCQYCVGMYSLLLAGISLTLLS